jgi:N-acetylated-alpha-linked acidic dipeptidase
VDHYARFGDPDGVYGLALAQLCGRAVLRLANAERLPLSFDPLAETLARYVGEVTRLADETREEIAERNRRLDEGSFELASDPKETFVAPRREPPAPHLNFAPLHNALARLHESARAYRGALADPATPARLGERAAQDRLNHLLLRFERSLTRAEGLPRRPWFKHHVYAPGFYTGYGVKTLPGVREAIEQHDWREAEAQILLAADTLARAATEIDAATAIIKGREPEKSREP